MILLRRFVSTGYYKKVLIAMCLCAVVFADSGFAGGQELGAVNQGPEVRDQEQIDFVKRSLKETIFMEGKFEYFKDFTVHLKDSNKKGRILICDVAIELNQGMKVSEEIAGLRKIIYKTLKELSGSPEIGRKLKEAIKNRLNSFMGDEIIKSVYFTKFFVL